MLGLGIASAALVLAALRYIPGRLAEPEAGVLQLVPVRVPPELTTAEAVPAPPGALSGCNLLLVTLDTTRADRIGCYGNEGIQTPTLDRLAHEGVLFSRAVAPVPTTTASHSSILTGLYAYHHGVRGNAMFRLGQEHETLAEILSARGYATGAAVSAFVLDSRFGLAQGFDDYQDDLGAYTASIDWSDIPERPADQTNGIAITWLRKHAGEQFFLWVHYFDPHLPYEPPSPYAEQYADFPYEGEIAFADSQLGTLLGAVEELGLTDDTLVVVAGDHGEGLGQHNEWRHGYLLYESTMHVPMLMRCGRRLGGGVHIARRVSLVDILPTVLSLLGIDWTGRTDGVDLTRPPDPSRLICSDTLYGMLHYGYAPLLAVYDDWIKYIHGPDPELYNLSLDPFEEQNLLASQPEIAADMQQRLRDFFGSDLEQATVAEPTVQLTADELAKLVSLGYVGETSGDLGGASSSVSRPDPKKMIVVTERVDAAIHRKDELGTERVIALLEEIAREHPDSHIVHYKLARCYAEQGDDARAEAAVLRSLEIHPDAPDALLMMAMGLQVRGDHDQALEVFRHQLSLYPDHADALARVGASLVALSRFDEAVDPLTRAFKMLPRDDNLREDLVRAYRATFRTDEAIGLLYESLRSQPELAGVRGCLSDLLIGKRRDAEAVALLREGLRVTPQNQELAHRLAELLATCPLDRIRRPAEAVAIMERLCAESQQERPEYLLTLSVAYMSAQQLDQAITAAQEAHRLASAAGRDELAQTIASKLESFKSAGNLEAAPAPATEPPGP